MYLMLMHVLRMADQHILGTIIVSGHAALTNVHVISKLLCAVIIFFHAQLN